MSQPYTDWELVESKKYDTYQYLILRVTDEKGTVLKGWVYAVGGTIWLEEENVDSLRIALMTHGRQLG